MGVAVDGIELDVAGEDCEGVVVLFLVVEEDVAGGLEGVLGDEALLEVSGVSGEGLRAGVDDVVGEAERRGIVRVVVMPLEDGMFASNGVGNDFWRDGESVLAVGEDDDGASVVEVDGDEGLVVGVVSPVPEVLAGGGLFDAPAESPEDFLGKRHGRGAVGAVGAGGIDGDLRSVHLAEGGGLEAAAAEDSFDEEGVVMGVGEKAGGGVAVEAFDGVAWLECGAVARCDTWASLRDVGGIVHAERGEDELLHDLVEGL